MSFKTIAKLGLVGAIFAAEASAADTVAPVERSADGVPILRNSRILSPGNGIPAFDRMNFDLKAVNKYGFSQVYKLKKDNPYTGNADKVILVYSSSQLMAAELYRKANFKGLKTDIAVCEDPIVQGKQLGKKSVIYNYPNL